MKLYRVSDDYITFLNQYDKKVANNKNDQRPYIGVVVQVNDIKYYAPLTSPKPKHKHMKNSTDFRKIYGGQYGAINFNNMIPVPDVALTLIDIANEPDVKYRRLLQNQYKALIQDTTAIENTAKALRTLVLSDDDQLNERERRIKARCCDLKTLEKVFNMFSSK